MITKQDIIDALNKEYNETLVWDAEDDWNLGVKEGIRTAINCINYLLDQHEDVASTKHGRWVIRDNPGTGWYRVTCSECGEDVTSVVPVIGFFPSAKVIWDFCPYCGAVMS